MAYRLLELVIFLLIMVKRTIKIMKYLFSSRSTHTDEHLAPSTSNRRTPHSSPHRINIGGRHGHRTSRMKSPNKKEIGNGNRNIKISREDGPSTVLVKKPPTMEDLLRRTVEIRVEMSQRELEKLFGRAQGTVTKAEWNGKPRDL